MTNKIENVLCPGCGCLCDDLVVTVNDNKITRTENSCAVSASKLLNYWKERLKSPMMRLNGELKPAGLKEAVNAAAEILVKSEYPLIYGWSLASCEAQRVGVELAEEVGGVIDNSTTVCHGPTILAVHDSGEPTCTLGEVKNRADLIIYWASNPTDAHPRHLERYTAGRDGRFRKRSERKIVLIDARRTSSAKEADLFIQVEPGKDYELLNALRLAVAQEEIEEESVAGVPLEQIEKLAEMMRSCEFGVVFFGVGLTMSGGKERNIEEAIALTRDLNDWTKFSIMPMRGHFNVTGANMVCTWQTGYPYSVDFTHGYPMYNPGETSAVDVVSRGENDATLVVASDPVSNFPRSAVKELCSKPLATIDPHMSLTAAVSDVVIPSAFAGIESGGVAYRMDGVGLRLKKLVDPPMGTLPDHEILEQILQSVKALRRGG